MKIAIDVSRAVNEKAGVGRYTYNLVKKLLEIDKTNQYILLAVFMRGEEEKEKIFAQFQQENVKIKRLKIPGKVKEMLWNSKINLLGKILEDSEIFLAPSFLDVIESLKIPQVVVIHDLTTFLYPEHLGKKLSSHFNEKTAKAVRICDHILTISQATKNDLIEKLKVNPEKVTIAYPGLADFKNIAKNLPASLKPKSYLLAVGTVEPRKNLVGLFKAYALLHPNLQQRYPLVVCGAKGWNTSKIFDTLKHLNLTKKVKMLGFISDAQLAKLYKEATIFIYPSLYEGFGFPVLEAMAFGTPTITSKISSLPEVAGSAGILVDPENPEEISRAIQQVIDHKEVAENLSKLSKLQARKFDFKEAADVTLGVLNRVREGK